MKREFTFLSTVFNCTDTMDYYINKGAFGDDVCRWLIERLQTQGVQTCQEPSQEDFGWYFTFVIQGLEHCVVVIFQPNNPGIGDRWMGWVERHSGFVGSILGRRDHGILPEAIREIDTALRSSENVHSLNWQEPTL